ncbi:LacI family DNA-binding transcriptional regulator [Bacillus horti]|uniref:LacI family transcriptional regulator n=1 Tax=Caldalkalibacillus horti TaxID=77523 RepID=A0ABT9W151_9BACI|nr:LacI family DNA-binding transcriptional regulator [Bacillus horti]MDQ0166993.1 LacI family transcriptional regulator [Bacillus horti]
MAQNNRTRVTLENVAKHAGVSRATASLVARNSPLIPEKTAKKVIQSMKELGYVYDRVAANLRSKSSNTVGMIITEISNPFFSELLAGVHESLDKGGYSVVLGTTFENGLRQDRILSAMLENRAGGIILSPVSDISEAVFKQYREWDVPIIQIAREFPGFDCDYIGINNILGGQLAVEHLIKKGHKRIAYLGGPLASSASQDRKKGYELALEQAGLQIDEHLVLNISATREEGIKGIEQLLGVTEPPTAVFCYNDVVALGVMLYLRRRNLVPGMDIDIVGFDNIPDAESFYPSLTTVSSFPRKVGKLAADLLHQRLNGLVSEPQRIILDPELVIRESG